MINFISISNKLDWNKLVPKIAPNPCALFLRDDLNFNLFWGNTKEYRPKEGFSFADFKQFTNSIPKQYAFGYLSYDLKNEIENSLFSSNHDAQNLPLAHFVVPEHAIICINGNATYMGPNNNEDLNILLSQQGDQKTGLNQSVNLTPRTSKESYLEKIKLIQEKIQRGDIYETNFCVSFESNTETFDGFEAFAALRKKSDAPFATYLNIGDCEIISASPERYISKRHEKIISQPIKGTAARASNPEDDEQLKKLLRNDPKEISENIMIVDLVRNDLSKIASKNSVKVQDLCAVHSFKTVHQLISTVSCMSKKDVDLSQIIRASFPMGSMTGAPKISAMTIAEKQEEFKRGVYSGALGLIHPNGNFDFNVVIRSVIYNKKTGNLSVPVGGAITIKSDPEKEYQECLIKLKAIQEVLC